MLGQLRRQPVGLEALIEQINAPTWTFADGERIYKALSRLIDAGPTNKSAILWRGILGRIMGYDARKDLKIVLKEDPTNRLAQLNLAVSPLTCLDVRLENKSFDHHLEIIDSFLKEHPQDYFGQLIKVALKYKSRCCTLETIDALESLYLRYPKRASTTALMAALFQECRNLRAACDFAQETLLLEPLNPVAHNIILRNKDLKEAARNQESYVVFPHSLGLTSIDTVFMVPHIQQDPDSFLLTPA